MYIVRQDDTTILVKLYTVCHLATLFQWFLYTLAHLDTLP